MKPRTSAGPNQLREWYVGKAMQGLLASGKWRRAGHSWPESLETLREDCFEIADAMLTTRPTAHAEGNNPDLLEALKELLHDAFEDAHPEAVKKARDAIAKAEAK